MTNTSAKATPSPYQRQLLIAALQDQAHRLPTDANSATLDLMRSWRWPLRKRLRTASYSMVTWRPKTRAAQVSSRAPNAWAELIAGAGITPASSMLAM